MHSKTQGYVIKAVINFPNAYNLEQFYKRLNTLRTKMEMAIPMKLRPKFTTGMEGLTIMINAEKINDASKLQFQLEDYIKSAIISA